MKLGGGTSLCHRIVRRARRTFGSCELVETEGDRGRAVRPERHVGRQLAGKPKPISQDATGGDQAQAGCERRGRLQRGGKLGGCPPGLFVGGRDAALQIGQRSGPTRRRAARHGARGGTPCRESSGLRRVARDDDRLHMCWRGSARGWSGSTPTPTRVRWRSTVAPSVRARPGRCMLTPPAGHIVLIENRAEAEVAEHSLSGSQVGRPYEEVAIDVVPRIVRG